MRTTEEKYSTVITKNTYFFFNPAFEESYESYLTSLVETLLFLKNKLETAGVKEEIFEELIKEKENGLKCILALTGFSNEYFKRITTLIRAVNDEELNKVVLKKDWCKDENIENIKEWSDNKIQSFVRQNENFRKGIVNLFFQGSTIPLLARTLPLFELKKLSISKLSFDVPQLIDTIIRYKEKGSYSGNKQNNPEILIERLLEKLNIMHEKGDLRELVDNVPDNKRTMDFIIPNKRMPSIIIECSYLVTTSSGQGDKAKTEISIDELLKKHYKEAKFIGFVDGIGWYVRKGDLERMVNAYEDVFTFHVDELKRFEQLLIETFLKHP